MLSSVAEAVKNYKSAKTIFGNYIDIYDMHAALEDKRVVPIYYHALADNESAKEILGDELLKKIAREMTDLIKQNTSIDWKLRETVRAKLRVMVKKLLKKCGYPPDKTQIATDLVLEQAELLSDKWVIAGESELHSNQYSTNQNTNFAVAEKKEEYKSGKKHGQR